MTIEITKLDLLEMKALRITGSEAARRKHCSIGVIRRAEKLHGVELYKNPRHKTKHVDEELLAKVKALVQVGTSVPKMCEILNEPYVKIKNICYQNGLRVRPTPKEEYSPYKMCFVPSTYGSESLLYKVPKELRELAVNRAWR